MLCLSFAKKRSTSTASSSNSHGTRYDEEPCSRLCEDIRPNAHQRLYTSAGAVDSKPLMSWLQKPKPQADSDSPARSRGYDALMQLLYQGLNSGDLGNMMGLGKQLLDPMDTNLNVMAAVTMVSAVQGGKDRRELLLSHTEQADAQEMRAAFYREVYE